MIESDIARQCLLALVALTFVVLAVRVLLSPEAVAGELGYTLSRPNGYNELYAIYFGLWLVTGALAVYAALRVQDPLPGDVVAALILAQPLGRLVAAIRYGLPQGPLLGFFALEVVGGLLLLAVRPGA